MPHTQAEVLGDSLCALVVFPEGRDKASWQGFISSSRSSEGGLQLSVLHPERLAPWISQACGQTGAGRKRKASFQSPVCEIDPHPDMLEKHEEKIAKYLQTPKKSKTVEEACRKMLEISSTFALEHPAQRVKDLLQIEVDRLGSPEISTLMGTLFPGG